MMTSRELWLAALRMEPVDRLPFWPKLSASYAPMQREPFRGMDLDALHDWMGSDKLQWAKPCVREVRHRSSNEHETSDSRSVEYYTVGGRSLRLVRHFDESSQAWHPVEHPARSAEDVELLTEFFDDVQFEPDLEQAEQVRSLLCELGDDGITGIGIDESPLMRWVEWLAGVENAHFMLADHTEAVEGLFDAMHRMILRKLDVMLEHCPADMLFMVENTSTTLISPAQFRRYCDGHLRAYAEKAREAGRTMVFHMCGHLKALLPELGALPQAGYEAFTSPPLGNTTLADGRTQMPEKCIIGGTNAVLWTRPAREIIAEIEAHLDALPHHRGLVVTSAGVMTPLAAPETIREVRDWVAAYPARM